jgi:type II secretory pathway pseudopilin PulG
VASKRRSIPARLRADEAGFTLVELLVASSILIVILGAVLALLQTSTRVEARDRERTHAIREAQVGVYRMTRELRQAYSITSSSGYSIQAHIFEQGSDHHVTYDCTGTSSAGPPYGQCVRFETGASGQGPASVVIDRLFNNEGSGRPPVFSFTTNGSGETTFAEVHIEAPAKGEQADGYTHRVVFDDGFYMRNLDG